MSEPWQPPVLTLRCSLTIDGVQETFVQAVQPEVWSSDPNLRTTIEENIRRQLGAAIAMKLAPPVVAEYPYPGLRVDQHIDVPEALRIAEAHAKALEELHARIEAGGLGFAWVASRDAAAAARALVDELRSDRAKLPVRPDEEPPSQTS